MEDEQEAELRNPFPSPPSHYANYTAHNLKLLSLLRERAEGQNVEGLTQNDILSDQADVPDWPLTSLEKPRVDWIREEGHYTVFGDTWLVRTSPCTLLKVIYDGVFQLKETIPSLGEGGGHQLYPEDAAAGTMFIGGLSSRSDLHPQSLFGRSTPGALVHPEVHGRHIFLLSGCPPCATTEHRVERASRMAAPSRLDHGPRAEYHGCRERSAAGSGLSMPGTCLSARRRR
jgi:hypothetical protein